MNPKQKEKSRWGPALPAVLGDRVMQLHERVLWRCAQGVCTAVGNEPWIALVGGTALRHITWLKRASLDLDFVVAGPGWQVGEWVRHVLARTEGVKPGSVQVGVIARFVRRITPRAKFGSITAEC